MIFVFPLTIPANTPSTAPVSMMVTLAGGNITAVHVQFPAGPLGLAHVYVQHGLNQLWPSNTESDFASDDETITWNEDIDLTASDCTLSLYGYNLDATFAHTITVRVALNLTQQPSTLAQQVAQLLASASQPAAVGA